MPTTLANVAFPNRYLNAAGCWCTTADELVDLHTSAAGGIVSKSCTELSRDGNVQPRFHLTDTLSINSTGLANKGVHFYGEFGRALRASNDQRKPYIVSVAGVAHGENVRLVQTLRTEYPGAMDLIELNLSCPNVAGKPQVGYDFAATREVLRQVFEADDGDGPPLGVKLPPYFDQSHFKGIAEVLGEYAGKGGAGGDSTRGHGLAFATCITAGQRDGVRGHGAGRIALRAVHRAEPRFWRRRRFGRQAVRAGQCRRAARRAADAAAHWLRRRRERAGRRRVRTRRGDAGAGRDGVDARGGGRVRAVGDGGGGRWRW